MARPDDLCLRYFGMRSCSFGIGATSSENGNYRVSRPRCRPRAGRPNSGRRLGLRTLETKGLEPSTFALRTTRESSPKSPQTTCPVGVQHLESLCKRYHKIAVSSVLSRYSDDQNGNYRFLRFDSPSDNSLPPCGHVCVSWPSKVPRIALLSAGIASGCRRLA